jgi:hypothetical protein
MPTGLEPVCTVLAAAAVEPGRALPWLREQLGRFDDAQIDQLLEWLLTQPPPAAGSPRDQLWAGLFTELAGRWADSRPSADGESPDLGISRRMAGFYAALDPAARARPALLEVLTARGDLQEFARLVVADPPTDPATSARPFVRLLGRTGWNGEDLFPALLEGLGQPAVAVPILELANFLARERRLVPHAASARRHELGRLLSGLAGGLARMQDLPAPAAASADDVSRVHAAVDLAVALCDALGLIGDPALAAKLYPVLELQHRRLRTEAAAALARLDDQHGREVLAALAAEPMTRLRVLEYAQQLGIEDRIEERFRTPQALAEARLAVWLSQPDQLGMSPDRLELVDSRRQCWPGFREPVACYLFRFSVPLPHARYENLGIAGPMVGAFAGDLRELPTSDVYAAFAGWQAEHPEIAQRDCAALDPETRERCAARIGQLEQSGYASVRPVIWGDFFGQQALVAAAVRGETPGTAIVDEQGIDWIARGNPLRPIDPPLAWSIAKGRQLLRAFNPPGQG